MVTAVAASAAAPLISLRRLKPPAAAPADWSGAFIWLVTVSSQDFFCWEGNREPTFRHKAGDVGEATRDGREECEGRAEPIVQCVIRRNAGIHTPCRRDLALEVATFRTRQP